MGLQPRLCPGRLLTPDEKIQNEENCEELAWRANAIKFHTCHLGKTACGDLRGPHVYGALRKECRGRHTQNMQTISPNINHLYYITIWEALAACELLSKAVGFILTPSKHIDGNTFVCDLCTNLDVMELKPIRAIMRAFIMDQ